MSVVLFRVDERLIHGQVVVGWGAQLHPERIVVIDDDLAGSDWEQELYTLGLAADLASDFVTVADARRMLPTWRASKERIIILMRDLGTLLRLAAEGALAGEQVNIGGIHHAPGRQPVLPYVYLSDEESAQLRALIGTGVSVWAQDVPSGRRVDAGALVPSERRAQ